MQTYLWDCANLIVGLCKPNCAVVQPCLFGCAHVAVLLLRKRFCGLCKPLCWTVHACLWDCANSFVRLCKATCGMMESMFCNCAKIFVCVCLMCVVCLSRVTVTACGALPGAKPCLWGALPARNFVHYELINSSLIPC